MRWPWPRRKDREAAQADADAALAASRQRRAEASQSAETARRSKAWWQGIRQENHFIEPFKREFGEGR